MTEYKLIISVIFFVTFIVAVSVATVNDPVHPVEDAGPSITLDDLSFQLLMDQAPQIGLIITPDPEATQAEGLWFAGVPGLEQIESFLRDAGRVVSDGLRIFANGFIMILNVGIAVSYSITQYFAIFFGIGRPGIFRFDTWPVFQGHIALQTFGVILTIVFASAIVLFVIMLSLRFIGSLSGAIRG